MARALPPIKVSSTPRSDIQVEPRASESGVDSYQRPRLSNETASHRGPVLAGEPPVAPIRRELVPTRHGRGLLGSRRQWSAASRTVPVARPGGQPRRKSRDRRAESASERSPVPTMPARPVGSHTCRCGPLIGEIEQLYDVESRNPATPRANRELEHPRRALAHQHPPAKRLRINTHRRALAHQHPRRALAHQHPPGAGALAHQHPPASARPVLTDARRATGAA
jgi:hypothetical protein